MTANNKFEEKWRLVVVARVMGSLRIFLEGLKKRVIGYSVPYPRFERGICGIPSDMFVHLARLVWSQNICFVNCCRLVTI
jgi:hypothetical protein